MRVFDQKDMGDGMNVALSSSAPFRAQLNEFNGAVLSTLGIKSASRALPAFDGAPGRRIFQLNPSNRS